jgi:2-iminoacetate synthase ThiH
MHSFTLAKLARSVRIHIELDHIGQGTAGGLGHRLEVLENAHDLGIDTVNHLHAGRVEADLAGQVNRIAHTYRL